MQKNLTNGIIIIQFVREWRKYGVLSDIQKQIEEYKKQFHNTIDENIRKQIIGNIAVHGKQGIDHINELISADSIINEEIRLHGLQTIKKL
ncbi:MAG: hypothetical protein L0H55_11135 [Candidatus Nitrosocosmicus sp.]|nr:hypothetical protein [Candidatus Nitrosocosmicus sp.]